MVERYISAAARIMSWALCALYIYYIYAISRVQLFMANGPELLADGFCCRFDSNMANKHTIDSVFGHFLVIYTYICKSNAAKTPNQPAKSHLWYNIYVYIIGDIIAPNSIIITSYHLIAGVWREILVYIYIYSIITCITYIYT